MSLSKKDLLKYNKIVFDLYSQGKSMTEIKQLILDAGFNKQEMQKIINYSPQKQTNKQQTTKQEKKKSFKIPKTLLFLTIIPYFKWLFNVKKELKEYKINMQTPLLLIPTLLSAIYLIIIAVLTNLPTAILQLVRIPQIIFFIISFATYFWFKITFTDAIFQAFEQEMDFMMIWFMNLVPGLNLYLYAKLDKKLFTNTT